MGLVILRHRHSGVGERQASAPIPNNPTARANLAALSALLQSSAARPAMLLTITTTRPPATDLSYLLHKNPQRSQSFDLAFGQAHVFYPEAAPDRCTAALLLDVDPVGLVRGRQASAGPALDQYVNDRPYVASSFLSVAVAQVFGSALAGRSKERPELADSPLPLKARLAVLRCRGGERVLRRLFEPLGYAVAAAGRALDEAFPDWGESPYFTVTLDGHCRLRDLLAHLYVLIPVLDDDKHYWVGADEVDKLLRHGEGWLAAGRRLAPFHLLATEGTVHVDHRHVWRLEKLAALCRPGEGLLLATPHRTVDLGDAASDAGGVRWWEELTAAGGEGMVVKPAECIARGPRGLTQPAVKCRGKEYLRTIYGPEYDAPEHLDRLRGRGLASKRSLALREFALGVEALERFVQREPLRRVHECCFGVLALESTPVDPRL
jgi:hypothetical protein